MLLLKLVLIPLLTVAVSLAARLWGHKVSGWLTAAPIVAGPIMAVLIIEQGADYAAQAAVGTLVTLPALAAYIVTFAWLARYCRWWACLLLSWCAFALVAAPLSGLQVGTHQALAIAWCGLGLGYLLSPNPRTRSTPAEVPRIEIALRVGAAVALMLVITYGAQSLGARLSGVLLSFPIGGSVLPAFTRALHGVEPTESLLHGFITGLLPFPLFFYALAALLPLTHPVVAFAAALVAIFTGHCLIIAAWRHASRSR